MHSSMTVKGSPQRTVAVATLGFFGGFAGVSVFGPLVPKFVHLMHLSPVAAGFLAAIANLTGALLRIPAGALVDRVGGKTPFVALLGLTMAGLAGLVWVVATHYPHHLEGMYPVLLLLGMLIGSGVATFPVGIAQIAYWHPRDQQGTPLGLYAGLGNLAPGFFALLLPLAVIHWGLVAAYALWLGLLLAITVMYFLTIHDAPFFQQRHAHADPLALTPPGSATAGLALAAREPATWIFVALYFTSFGGFLALVAWLPSVWVGAFHVSLATGGLLTLSFATLASLVRAGAGMAADRRRPVALLIGALVVLLVGSATVLVSRSLIPTLIGVWAMAIGMGIQNAVVFKLIPVYVPRAVGGAAGWVGGLGAFGGFVIPPVMALLGGKSHSPVSFEVFVGLVLMNLAVAAWLPHASPKPESEAVSQSG